MLIPARPTAKLGRERSRNKGIFPHFLGPQPSFHLACRPTDALRQLHWHVKLFIFDRFAKKLNSCDTPPNPVNTPGHVTSKLPFMSATQATQEILRGRKSPIKSKPGPPLVLLRFIQSM